MKRIILYIHVSFFIILLLAAGIGLLFAPKNTFSEREKRRLSRLPVFYLPNLAKGNYMDSLDNFTADHFPQRNWFLELADSLKSLKGIQKEGKKVYADVSSTDAIIEEDSSGLAIFKDTEQNRNSKGLVVSKGQAFHIFTNENSMAKDFAQALNAYPQKFKLRFFCAIVPTLGTYKIPKEYEYYANKELENIQEIHDALRNVEAIPIHEEMKKHLQEYIYYRTDHHWTALGAYYGYVAFCKKIGFEPQSIKEMPKKFVEGKFLGTHFLKTNDASLKANADTVFYWIPNTKEVALKWNGRKMEECPTFKLDSIEKNRYLVFLGGDEPFMQLTSKTVKNKRVILVIKNSYGNPFVSYLTAHYEQVLVLDYRYFKGSLSEIIKNYKVNDLLFLSGVFAANEPSHIKKIKKLIG
jgi:hypothetical protein